MNQAAFQFDKTDYPAGFFRWLDRNHDVYSEFRKHAVRMASYRKHYSAKTIFEVIRWHTDLHDTDRQFSLNNNYTSGCARLFMQQYGHLYPDFFRLRDSQGLDVESKNANQNGRVF